MVENDEATVFGRLTASREVNQWYKRLLNDGFLALPKNTDPYGVQTHLVFVELKKFSLKFRRAPLPLAKGTVAMRENPRLLARFVGLSAGLFILFPGISALPQSLTPASNPDISFRNPLRVIDVLIPNNQERRRSEYHFTLNFPADAVEPLEKIVFEQVEGAGYPRYRDNGNYAFDGTSQTSLTLAAVENDRDNRTITVQFDPPVEPGRQVTVVLNARNPRDGIYTYQLTAFPVGATEGQYAGVERLHFYEPVRRRRDRFDWL